MIRRLLTKFGKNPDLLDRSCYVEFQVAVIFNHEPQKLDMAKKKTGGKVGRREHFTGYKRAFLDARSASYLQALDSRKQGEFYDQITRDFIAKYGDDLDASKDVVEDLPDPEDFEHGDRDQMSQEEAVVASERFDKIREVSKEQFDGLDLY